MAVVAPIPSASVNTRYALEPWALGAVRSAWRMSCSTVSTVSLPGFDFLQVRDRRMSGPDTTLPTSGITNRTRS
jgi:hypothetical protein